MFIGIDVIYYGNFACIIDNLILIYKLYIVFNISMTNPINPGRFECSIDNANILFVIWIFISIIRIIIIILLLIESSFIITLILNKFMKC